MAKVIAAPSELLPIKHDEFEAYYVVKRNRTWLKPNLYHAYKRMINLCAVDLARSGVIARVLVTFQTGRSRSQNEWCGLYEFDPSINHFDHIWIYTYGRKAEDILMTIAHEFGHMAHYRTVPTSYYWSDNLMEQYANLWAKATYNRFLGNETLALWAEDDLAEFRKTWENDAKYKIWMRS